VRTERKALVLLALLLTHGVTAQEDLNDADLKTLLEDEAPPVKEASEAAEAGATVPATDPAVPAATEAVAGDTVDLEALEGLTADDQPAETTLSNMEPTTPSVEKVETDPATSIEALPADASPETTLTDTPAEKIGDDLESIKADLGDDAAFEPATTTAEGTPEATPVPSTVTEKKEKGPEVFDVGREERELLSLAQNIQGQITDPEWNEVATAAKVDTYTVVKDDWLFKISKRIFGSGFYYPKIWSLNSFITNPHFIEPGMVLSFTTGSGSQAPEVKLGTFSDDELNAAPGAIGNDNPTDLANFGEDSAPPWISEKGNLEKQGVYFQYASEETMEDLTKASEQALNREYENYEPPKTDFDVVLPKNYDKSGFDNSSKIFYSFKQGFYLSTFVTTNLVQDFGAVTNGPDENIFFTTLDHAYVKFDESMNVLPGDKFSIYSSGGKVSQENSDREGYKYSIVGHIKLLRKIQDKWEVEFIEVAGTPQRGDRITAYTPKIDRITRTFNSRLIEAGILASYQPRQTVLAYGDVVYLDRGRADGVEMGNVFEIYGFKDRALGKNITDQPTYKLGEVTVITLTDNFATALVSGSVKDFYAGDIAITKTKEAHLREQKARRAQQNGDKDLLGGKALEELDVELNLENLNEDLLNQADKIQLTEDELAELERQEREKSVIKDSEKDLKALERLENEIEQAEKILNDAKLDEDKLLEQENLNEIEEKRGNVDQESLDEIEENLGKRYVDEDLNSKDNPYGLTEFDVEEVDELLNVEKKDGEAPAEQPAQ
jgi:nucleoid-associated protein YgaU